MTDEEIIRGVAEKIMGWKREMAGIPQEPDITIDAWTKDGKLVASAEMSFFDNDGWTGMILDRMVELGWLFHLTYAYPSEMRPDRGYNMAFYRPQDREVSAKNWTAVCDKDRKRAIVMAALKAVEK